MARLKGAPKTGGRIAGTPNKLTVAAKVAFEFAFAGIGGKEALTTWARANQTEFYKLYARLIPSRQELSGSDGGPMKFANLSDDELEDLIRQQIRAAGIRV